MRPSRAREFRRAARAALTDPALRGALGKARGGFVDKRREAAAALPEFDSIRDHARQVREHTFSHLDFYLERFEQRAREAGTEVHWARTAEEANTIIASICRQAGAVRVAKGKSMVAEEMGLNEALEAEGLEVVETDLGEYIIQLAGETPSHIIAPAVHKTREQITELFHEHHRELGFGERVTGREEIVAEARQVLRRTFLGADVGITGANFLVAETGSTVLVTNEGNGDLVSILPRVHIVTASIEKVIPTLEDLSAFLRLLARSATGQEITAYTTLFTGPRREDEPDGPEAFHVVLLDNGRSELLRGDFHDILRCIRCGACLNHCPVYGAIGGHAYGWVYPGPMGAVWTPLMVGLEEARDLPNACTLNGRCREICPVRIPLPDLLRRHRQLMFRRGLLPPSQHAGLRLWAWIARHPDLYGLLAGFAGRAGGWLGRRRGSLRHVPLAGGWTRARDLPAPRGRTFRQRWKAGER